MKKLLSNLPLINCSQESMPVASRGSQKNKYGRRNRTLVSHDDVLELLAWIDFCIYSDRNGQLFKQSVVNHFRQDCDKVFTFHQIDQKVLHLWLNHRHGEARNFNDHQCLYRIGTAGLSNFTKDWRETRKLISRRVMELRLHKLRRTPLDAKRSSGNIEVSKAGNPKAAKLSHSMTASPFVKSESYCSGTPTPRPDHPARNDFKVCLVKTCFLFVQVSELKGTQTVFEITESI